MKNFYKNALLINFFILISLLATAQIEPRRQWSSAETGTSASNESSELIARSSTTPTNGNYYSIGSGNGSYIYILTYSSAGTLLSNFNYSFKNAYYYELKNAFIDASNNLIITGINYSSAGSIAFATKFSTANSSNAVLWERGFKPKEIGFYALTKTMLKNGALYFTGTVEDTLWCAKVNASNGNLIFNKKYKVYNYNTSLSTAVRILNLTLTDFTIDNNKALILTGSCYRKRTNTLAIPGNDSVTDAFLIKLDSTFTTGQFSATSPFRFYSGTLANTSSQSYDVSKFVVTDNANNIYMAVQYNDTVANGFDRGKIVKVNSTGSTVTAAPWSSTGDDIATFSNYYKDYTIFKGLEYVQGLNAVIASYEKPYFHKTMAQRYSNAIENGLGMSLFNTGTGLTWSSMVPKVTGPFAYSILSAKDLSKPLTDILGSNLYMFYNSTVSSFVTAHAIKIVKLNVTTGAQTSYTYNNTQGYSLTIDGNSAVADNNGVPAIVGRAYYSTSRYNDAIIIKPNTANTAISFEDYYNDIVSGYNNASRLFLLGGSTPLVVGTKNSIGTGSDIFLGRYDVNNGAGITSTIDKTGDYDYLLDANIPTGSASTLYTLSASGSKYYVDRNFITSGAISSTQLIEREQNNLQTDINASIVKYHSASVSLGGYIYVGGAGPGGDICLKKYNAFTPSITNSALDSVPTYNGTFYPYSTLRSLILKDSFAYGLYVQYKNAPLEPTIAIEKIDLKTMQYSGWNPSLPSITNLKYVDVYDLKEDNINVINANKFYYMTSGYDTSFNQVARIVRINTGMSGDWYTDVDKPNGTYFSGPVKYVINPTNGSPYTVSCLNTNQIFVEEYSPSSGAVVSSDLYNLPNNFIYASIADVEFNNASNKIVVAINGADSLYNASSIVMSINLTTNTVTWNYVKAENNSTIRDIALNTASSNRIYIAGNQPNTSGSIGRDIFLDKVCDIPPPQLNYTNNISFCANSVTSLINTPAIGSLWNTGATTSSIIPATSGYYKVTNTQSDGCVKSSDSLYVDLKQPITKQMCFVSFDRDQNKIRLYFDNFKSQGVDSVIIHRDFGANTFARVGAITADSTWWQDNTLGTTITQALAYKIQVKDTCGQYGPLSDYHKPVFVTSFPTVTAGSNNINFETYQHQSIIYPGKYFNLKGYNIVTSQWDSITNIPAPTSGAQLSFTITFTPSTLQLTTYGSNYRIDAKLDTTLFQCDIGGYDARMMQQTKGTKGGPSHSNLKTNITLVGEQSALQNASIISYPNPNNDGKFTIQSSNYENLTYQVINANGSKIITGAFFGNTILDLGNCGAGVYMLLINDGKYTIKQQLIKN